MTVDELKEMIVELKLELVEATIPEGNCPYCYYTPSTPKGDCDISCNVCRRIFMRHMEIDIRKEVSSL